MTAAPVTICCAVTRASVSMGDDAAAPNRRDYELPVAPDEPDPRGACLKAIVLDYGYVPGVYGGSTWLASVDGVRAAVVVRRADGLTVELIPIPGAALPADMPERLDIHFAYYLNVDPARLLHQIAAGERIERVYTPDAPWMA